MRLENCGRAIVVALHAIAGARGACEVVPNEARSRQGPAELEARELTPRKLAVLIASRLVAIVCLLPIVKEAGGENFGRATKSFSIVWLDGFRSNG